MTPKLRLPALLLFLCGGALPLLPGGEGPGGRSAPGGDAPRRATLPAPGPPPGGLAPAGWPTPTPVNLTLTVRETAGVARSGEVVRSGVPVPRSLNLLDTAALTLVDAGGNPVPAEFQALARWDAGREQTGAPIQWLLVTFPASVQAGGSAAHRLVTDGSAGSNPPPPVPLSLTRSGNQVTVNTGVAIFKTGGNPGALFDEVRLADGTRLLHAPASGADLTARVNGSDTSLVAMRNVSVEHAGPLAAVVVVQATYDLAPVGGGRLSSRLRYTFTSGSPVAQIRHSLQWEGDLCPGDGWDLTCDPDGRGQVVNGLRVERARDALTLDLDPPLSVLAVGDSEAAPLQGIAAAGQPAWVRQQLRAGRLAPLAFDLSVPGAPGAGGEKADGAMLSVGAGGASVSVALNHLHRYEPGALRLLADGRLAVDLADDQVWLGQRQGLFATFAVGVQAGTATRADLDRLLWAPLNRPLRAWPAPEWWAASGTLDEFPVGPLPPEWSDYDALVEGVLDLTLREVDERGLPGMMTFGLYPRIWGHPWYSDELDCGDDPTPGDPRDDAYWCGTWTDYHNTVAAAAVQAMRTGEVEWLDEIATPGALRSLHTQIMQCAPDDPWFYCAQAPAGYGGYRSDFNGSHAYFDNLFLYYWLTGDYTVVETLQRGAATMRDFLCFRRPAAPCLPDDPPSDYWAQLTGRAAMQWGAIFRFLGLASDDPGYLDDYRANLARAVTQHYVQAQQNGRSYGFWLYGGDPVRGPGDYTTDQLWMVSLYDMNLLYRLANDTGDAPIGNPPIPPSQALAAWARTLTDFGATTAGDGTAAGDWPNALHFSWTGARIGGTLVAVSADLSGGDPYLYDTGKATLTAVLVRAGQGAAEEVLTGMGADLAHLAIASAQNPLSPLGKFNGEYLARLPAAVGRLAGTAAGTFADVPPGHWAYAYIEALAASGITGGCGGALYCPDDPVTRAQMAVFLLRGMHGAGYAPPGASGGAFDDVPASHWAAAWIEQLAAEGITGGCGGESFCPEGAVSRAEMAVFLLRAGHGAAYQPPAAAGQLFDDVPASHWAAAWIEQLATEGITGGCAGGLYCPEAAISRAEMAVFLARTFGLRPGFSGGR